jgi:hypothetical protein
VRATGSRGISSRLGRNDLPATAVELQRRQVLEMVGQWDRRDSVVAARITQFQVFMALTRCWRCRCSSCPARYTHCTGCLALIIHRDGSLVISSA